MKLVDSHNKVIDLQRGASQVCDEYLYLER